MTHQQLQTIDADTLLSTTLPPTRFIIDRLLPQGLHILAGAPKVGKSWLALWLCLQVAQGTSVWDFPTHRGTVLYLCLEDRRSCSAGHLHQAQRQFVLPQQRVPVAAAAGAAADS